jgi:hypothetical protein
MSDLVINEDGSYRPGENVEEDNYDDSEDDDLTGDDSSELDLQELVTGNSMKR